MPKTPKRAGRVPQEGARFFDDVVAQNVRARRVLDELSQADLAGKMSDLGHEWTQGTVSDIERGERNVTVRELVDLALVFDLRLAELLDPQGVDGRGGPVEVAGTIVPPEMVAAWIGGSGVMKVHWYPKGPAVVLAGRSIEDVDATPEETP